MIKCTCGLKDCNNTITILDHSILASYEWTGEHPDRPHEVEVYLDANGLVQLIRDAKVALNKLVGEEK